MNELTTLSTLAVENLLAMGFAHYDQCENAQQQAVVNAAKSGMYFLEAKSKMKHGEFMPKIAQLRADISHSKINKYMQLSKEMPELLNSDARPNLNYAQAIALMSAPEELKTEIVERIDNGEEISSREIQRLKKEAAEAQAKLDCVKNDLIAKTKSLESAEAKVRFQKMTIESTEKQNNELRERDQALIDAKVAEAKAQLILENQQAIAEAKRERDNTALELEKLKKEQAKAINDGVTRELNKLDTEINQKRYRIEMYERDLKDLQKVKSELDDEVGAMAIHKAAIKQSKDDLSSLALQISDAFDTNTIPSEVFTDWQAIRAALKKLDAEMDNFFDDLAPLDSVAIVGELVEVAV